MAGIAAYIVIALFGTVLYLLFYKFTGPRVDPLVGGAIAVFLPMILGGFGLLVWVPAWTLIKWRKGQVLPRFAAMAAMLFAVAGAIVFCGGFACFLGGKSEHFVGWFFVACVMLGTAAHSAIFNKVTGVRGKP